MERTVGERIKARLEEFTEALESGEPIQAKFTSRRVEFRLEPQTYDPGKVKETRDLLRASQNIFAMFLGTSVKTIQAWEQGTNAPNKMACRFMDLIRSDPDRWRQTLHDELRVKNR